MSAHLSKAERAWKGTPPPFVVALAELADRSGLAAAGAAIGYGKAAVSLVLSARYGAGLGRIEAAVNEKLGISTVCPVLGDITEERCAREQAGAQRNRSLLGGMLRNACRDCPRRNPS
ncbi:hypothetical protein J2847_005123 [Azospirillum agricola]|uniref:hypothetical protein n=1 Tax=Azospirillum agricola TaxID=1720247 RepID=UPI001AE3C24D|nr:hypothetical protein [Azospirillum agricola]MBP2231804.1 hypothetical protein [Azospirillum agricola]